MASTAWPDLWEIAIAEGGSAEARARLVRIHAELFAGTPARDAETVRSFEAIALGFLPRVDGRTLLDVAAMVAPCPDTPASVLEFLVARSPETRDVVAATAPRLPAPAVDILLGSPAGRLLLARRPDLDAPVLRSLLVLHDPALDRVLAVNPALDPSDAAFQALLRRAREDAELARALLRRGDLPVDDEAALYLAAPPERRGEIRARMAASARYGRPALPFRANGGLVSRLLASAAERDVTAVEALLSAGLGLPEETDWRLLRAGRQELLGLGLKALGIDEEDAVRIGLTLHPALSHSVPAIGFLAETMRSVPRPIALALVEAILGLPAAHDRSARHEPFLDPAQRAPVRPAASRVAAAEERARQTGKG